MCLSGKDHEADLTARGIHHGHDLAGQAAPGASDTLPGGPSLAPAAFRCACTMVPPPNTYPRSNSSGSSLKTCSKMPETAHLRNRLKTRLLAEMLRCVAPGRSGADAPQYRLEKQPAHCRAAPGSVALPGSMGQVRAHMAPASTVLSAFMLISVLTARAVISAVVAARPAPAWLIRKSIVNRRLADQTFVKLGSGARHLRSVAQIALPRNKSISGRSISPFAIGLRNWFHGSRGISPV